MLQNFDKHIQQIKKGGIIVIIKKLRFLIFLILQIPIYLISIPLIILIRLIRPWFLIRWAALLSNRIGHFSVNTELYCCERDAGINLPSQKYLDIFYIKKLVCNKQLEKMWRRSSLIILPFWLLNPLSNINRFINIFIPGGNYHRVGNPVENICHNSYLDVHNLCEKFQPHIGFTEEEEFEGKRILAEFGVPKGAKFVCLIARDSAYLDRQNEYNLRDWSYHNHRDVDIDKYILSAEELAKRGYYIFRMGAKVNKPLISSNPKIIDYATSGMRTEFMDIYLGAKCDFCLSSGTGFDGIPYIFRKPVAYTNLVEFGCMISHHKNNLIITKSFINKKNKKKLSIADIFSSNFEQNLTADKLELNDIELKENSPEEIRDLVIEMDERLNGNWNETKEDLLLQEKFWMIWKENIKRLNLKIPMYGKIKSRFGSKYLRENQYLFDRN
tara:strand:- start:278 stop:1603 length:1326 start_codon:yes stop_codon:yes gene_type:complete